jgi:ParB family chromosome partitioning protein
MPKALGKGIESLIQAFETKKTETNLQEIPLEKIKTNPYQARIAFNEEKINELAKSIKQKGLLQPVILKPSHTPDEYILIAGERRFRAAKLAGLQTIPAIIKDSTEEETALFSLIENIQRENLNPIEEARAYKNLLDKFSLTQEQLSELTGKDRAVIANSIRLLSLPEEVIEMLISGLITPGHARALAGLDDKNKQIELSNRIIKEKLTVRDIEDILKLLKPKRKKKSTPEVILLEDELQKTIGLKIKIKTKGKKATSGKIEIYFHTLDEFDKILNILKKTQP